MSRPLYYLVLAIAAAAILAGLYFQRGCMGADDVCLWPYTQ